MKPVKDRWLLLLALTFLGIAGLVIHMRIHPFYVPPGDNAGVPLVRWRFFPATILCLADVVLVTSLFLRKGTAVYGYLLNGLLVIYGTVIMAHFSLTGPTGGSLVEWALWSTLPDIGVSWADFIVGKMLFAAWMRET